jgi:Ricin-type beta-trefoil lectin domain
MRFVRRSRRRLIIGLVALVAVAVPVAVAVAPANAAPFPRFVSVGWDQVHILQPVTSVNPGDGGSYTIFATAEPRACIDADSDTVGHNGGKVQTWSCNGTRFQKWAFDSTDVVGLYRMRTFANGRCLDADNTFGGGNGTRVQVWDCLGLGQRNQFFWLVDNTTSLMIVSNLDGRCLQADDVFDNGGPIQLFDCDFTDQEQWMPQTF